MKELSKTEDFINQQTPNLKDKTALLWIINTKFVNLQTNSSDHLIKRYSPLLIVLITISFIVGMYNAEHNQ